MDNEEKKFVLIQSLLLYILVVVHKHQESDSSWRKTIALHISVNVQLWSTSNTNKTIFTPSRITPPSDSVFDYQMNATNFGAFN